MKPKVKVPTDAIALFCQRHKIRELALFGSGLREDFEPTGDIDLLIDFEPGVDRGLTLMDLAGMQIELSEILQREVDLVLRDSLKPRMQKI